MSIWVRESWLAIQSMSLISLVTLACILNPPECLHPHLETAPHRRAVKFNYDVGRTDACLFCTRFNCPLHLPLNVQKLHNSSVILPKGIWDPGKQKNDKENHLVDQVQNTEADGLVLIFHLFLVLFSFNLWLFFWTEVNPSRSQCPLWTTSFRGFPLWLCDKIT